MSLIAQCPNCTAKFNASQAMLDSYGGFFRCGKCDYKFNYYDQFDAEQENITDYLTVAGSRLGDTSSPDEGEGVEQASSIQYEEPRLDADSGNTDSNIIFNQYDDVDDEIREPKLEPVQEVMGPFAQQEDDAEIIEGRDEVEEETFTQAQDASLDDQSVEYLEERLGSSADLSGLSEERPGDVDLSEARADGRIDIIDDEDEFDNFVDESLIVELEQEFLQERKAVLGENGASDSDFESLGREEPLLPEIETDPSHDKNDLERTLSILDDVEEETKVIGSLDTLWVATKHIINFFFWLIVILALLGLLIYQFKPRLATSTQEKIEESPIVEYLCKYIECEGEVDPNNLEVVVSRMDLDATPSEPLNVSLFILNRLKEPHSYPVIKLSLKNLQGQTVGQRFLTPADYLKVSDAVIPAGNIGKVILKLDKPPETAVGFEVSLH